MIEKSYKSNNRLLLAGRIGLIAAALGILVASYFYYCPRNFPFSNLSPQAGQTLLYGGLAFAIAAFAYRWPGAGGVIAIMHGIDKISEYWRLLEYPRTLVPAPLINALYGIFIIGGILGLYADLRREQFPYAATAEDKKLLRTARITAFAPIVICIAAFNFIYPAVMFYAVPVLFIAGIAWFWPAPGGILLLAVGIPGFYQLYNTNWGLYWKLPLHILLAVFVASGILHLIIAWRRAKRMKETTG